MPVLKYRARLIEKFAMHPLGLGIFGFVSEIDCEIHHHAQRIRVFGTHDAAFRVNCLSLDCLCLAKTTQ
jgi:hypothetical protein